MVNIIRIIGFAICLGLLVSCGDIPDAPYRHNRGPGTWTGTAGGGAAAPNGDHFGGFTSRGQDQYYNEAALGAAAPERVSITNTGSDTVQLNLVNASVPAAANAVLRDALGRNFVIADGVEGRVTLQTTGAISKGALLELFQDALALNGARLVDEGGQLQIVRADGAARNYRSAGANGPSAIIVAPLNHVSPQSMLTVLQPVIDEGLWARADNARNLILFSGTASQLNSAMEALNIFDVDVFAGKSIGLFPLRRADPTSAAAELQVIFETEAGGRLEGSIEFVPNPEMRSILVIATRGTLLDQARSWIARLDSAAAQSGTYTQVYPLNYRSAEEMAGIINALVSGGAGAEGAAPAANASDIRVSADPTRNAIVARAGRSGHDELSVMIRDLDTNARQVMIEATIAEVTLTDDISLGVRWFFENGPLRTTLTDLSSGGTGATSPGFSSVFSGLNAQVALNALSSVTDVHVVSSPTLMVAENKTAILRIGDQVPVATQRTAGTTDIASVTTIEYRDTGVILNVTPRVGANGNIVLHIRQEVSDVVNTTTSGIDSPTIRLREIETTVTVQNGATLTLGGMMQERSSRGQSGIPGARRAPILGALFGNRNRRFGSTELLILIRPIVITNASQAEQATAYWRGRLAGADGVYTDGVPRASHILPGVNQ